MVTESGMNRQRSMSSAIMQSLTFTTFKVSGKITMLQFFLRQPGGLACLTLIIT